MRVVIVRAALETVSPRGPKAAQVLSSHGHNVILLGWDRERKYPEVSREEHYEAHRFRFRAPFGPKVLDSSVLISAFCPQFTCKLLNSEAVGELSNVGLIATMVYSPIPSDPVVGTQFLFAIGNFPLRVKTDVDAMSIIITLQF